MASNKFIITGLADFAILSHTMEVWGEECQDEYHSMTELYQHRMALTIALFNSWYHGGPTWHNSPREDIEVLKSKLHHDGTMFEGGYFIVMALTQEGQISYHYKLEHWDEFDIPEVERAPEWDGHTSLQVLERLKRI